MSALNRSTGDRQKKHHKRKKGSVERTTYPMWIRSSGLPLLEFVLRLRSFGVNGALEDTTMRVESALCASIPDAFVAAATDNSPPTGKIAISSFHEVSRCSIELAVLTGRSVDCADRRTTTWITKTTQADDVTDSESLSEAFSRSGSDVSDTMLIVYNGLAYRM